MFPEGCTESPKTYTCGVPNGELIQGAGLSVGENLRKEVGEKPSALMGNYFLPPRLIHQRLANGSSLRNVIIDTSLLVASKNILSDMMESF